MTATNDLTSTDLRSFRTADEALRAEPTGTAADAPTAVSRHATDVGYYGHPIVKPHVWLDHIGWYFFTGGIAGASSVIAAVAQLAGRPHLARHARRAAIVGLLPSPPLLVFDLGRPERFAYMLRVLRPTSPMSVGSWLLAGYSALAGGAFALRELGRLPRVATAATLGAGAAGSLMTTYTAVLVADTATPAWHEARRELPFVFAASAAASGAAVTSLLAIAAGPPDHAAARASTRIAVAGALAEVGLSKLMTSRLGELDTYATDPAASRFHRAAQALALGGSAAMAAGRWGARRRPTGARLGSLAGAAAVAASSACERFAVLRAGAASGRDPRSVLVSMGRDPSPQRPSSPRT